ncbi:MAG: glycoside hydrolase family 20 zincin-like fold domain-containing protein [Terriglobia bacterium]
MRRMFYFWLFGAAFVGICAATPLVAQSPLFARGYTVVPQPQQVKLEPGDFTIGDGWRLQLDRGVKASDVAVETLEEGLSRRYGITLETGKASPKSARTITLTIQPGSVTIGKAMDQNTDALEQQAYNLELGGNEIHITANAPTGLFYGIETLVQLVRPAKGKLWLPVGSVKDWPDLEMRNIYWDDNHHLDRINVLKEALRRAAFYKINGFVIKLNGHFQYQSAPAVVDPYALSAEQLQELTNYGLHYHIQLIPYLDAPAHISFILRHPEYAGLREFPDSNYELCTTNPNSYKLLDGMYQNLLDANRGVKYFLLSTDESYYIGLADNNQCHSAQLEKQLGSVGKVLAAFLDKAAGYLHGRGRSVIFWGEYPLKPDDIPSLPSYLINGEIYGPEFDRAFKARGIRQMIYTSTEGVEQLFPRYYILPPSHLIQPGTAPRLFHRRAPQRTELEQMYHLISFTPARRNADLMGTIVAAWGDMGLHPETFWLGYTTGSSWGWHSGSPSPGEAESSFFHLFYGQGSTNMGRVYQLMSTQAQAWMRSWSSEPSSARKPIFGNSYEIFKPPRPAHDQTLPLPPVPKGEYLRLPFDWDLGNAGRVEMAERAGPPLAELFDLLHENLRSVQFNRYNLEVFLSIAGLYRQNLQMLEEMEEIDSALEAAQTAAAQVQFARATAALDRALDIAQAIKKQRNATLQSAVETWYKSWYPRVAEANGRKYLNAIDDVKDHLPGRTVDMSYLVYREKILALGEWYDQVEAVRNRYAEAHHLPVRSDRLNWKDTKTASVPGA